MCFICVVLFVQLTKTIYTYTTLKDLNTTCFSSLHHPLLQYKLPSTDFCFYHTFSLFSNIAAHCVIFLSAVSEVHVSHAFGLARKFVCTRRRVAGARARKVSAIE